MGDRPRLLPVVLATVAFPLVLVTFRFAWPAGLGAGVLQRRLVEELVLAIVTLALVAWARWWRQTGLAGPWRRRWWVLLPVGLLVVQLLFNLPGLLVLGDPTRLPLVLPLVGLVGFCEETLTRGVMLYGLSRFGPLAAGLVSAAIFGVLHALGFISGLPVSFLVVQMTVAALLGLLFAGVRLRMISLWPLVAVHAVFDVPALLEGYPLHVQPLGLGAAVFSIGLVLPFGLAGFGLLLWAQLNGANLPAAVERTVTA